MSSSRSSRRAANTASSSALYRGLALIHSVSKCSRAQRRQDADHDDLGAGLVRPVPRRGRARRAATSPGPSSDSPDSGRGWHVELDVVAAELGLEVRVGDGLQHLGVGHRRLPRAVDQVELDLQPGQRIVEVEGVLDQHPLEHVEAPPHLRRGTPDAARGCRSMAAMSSPIGVLLSAGERDKGEQVVRATGPSQPHGGAARRRTAPSPASGRLTAALRPAGRPADPPPCGPHRRCLDAGSTRDARVATVYASGSASFVQTTGRQPDDE